ncbi:MAG: hypothetical protein GY850_41355 [bacterium]|nr:hypothetical protein [bacterium]
MAIPGPLKLSIDIPIIGVSRIEPGMLKETPYTKALTSPADSKYKRAFETSLSLGLSECKVGQESVFVLGGGIRKRIEVFSDDLEPRDDLKPPETLQVDLDTYIPFYAVTEDAAPLENRNLLPESLRSIQLGLAVTRNKNALVAGDSAAARDIAGLRFNATVSFDLQQSSAPGSLLDTNFGPPRILVQKLTITARNKSAEWQNFTDESWKTLVNALTKITDVNEMLKAPLGPTTVEEVDYGGISGLIKKGFDPMNRDLKQSEADAAATAAALRGFMKTGSPPDKGQAPADEKVPKDQSTRSLGDFLNTLGLLKKDPQSFERTGSSETRYTLTDKPEDLNFWRIMNDMVNQLDGFPLYVSGVSPKRKDDEEQEEKPKPAPDKELRVAAQLATVTDERNRNRHFFGLRGALRNIPLVQSAQMSPKEREEAKTTAYMKKMFGDKAQKINNSNLDVMLHLGKWFSGETLDDNWFRRLLPRVDGKRPPTAQPGIGLYPLSLTLPGRNLDGPTGGDSNGPARFAQNWRTDLIGVGLDIIGATDDGLFSVPHFRIGGVEVRGLLALEFLRSTAKPGTFTPVYVWGLGVKLDGMRLSLAKQEKKTEEDEILEGVQKLFSDAEDEAAGKQKILSTGLERTEADEAAEKAGFSLSVGYLSPLRPDQKGGTLDVQLYDAKGKRGKVVWVPVDRGKGPLYMKNFGVALAGMENIELSKGLGDKAKLSLLFTGGLRFSAFELGLIGAGVTVPFAKPSALQFKLQGIDVSVKVDPVRIAGNFLKSGREYAGALRIELPAFSIGAMGAFGTLKDGTTTMFIYGAFSAAAGGGIGNAAVKITGLALGFGINRRVKVPYIEGVARFSMVKMVMGQGGLQQKQIGQDASDSRDQLGKSLEDPLTLLERIKTDFPAEAGQYFGCIGLRFTLAETVDCFALLIAQFGKELEFTLLGLARLKLPKTTAAKSDAQAICYAELQLMATLKPNAGSFMLEAQLTANSWVFNKDCRLTGGFAICFWYGGEHKGDLVITLGGYNPGFRRPAHYPMVPRLGISWQITEQLLVKGGLYLAVTPSSFMVGIRLEAAFRSGRIAAWFTANVEFLMEWKPVFYQIDVGISLRIEADLNLFPLSLTLGVELHIWGQPFGGKATVSYYLLSFDIPFGSSSVKPEPIEAWPQFGRSFLDPIKSIDEAGKITQEDPDDSSETGKWTPPTNNTPLDGPDICRPVLSRGGLIEPADPAVADTSNPPKENQKEDPWLVRGDELEFTARTVIPATRLHVGRVKTNSPPVGVQPLAHSGKSLSVGEPVALCRDGRHSTDGAPVGARPMGIESLNSQLNVTVVRDREDGVEAVDLSRWTVEPETTGMPAALWDTERADPTGPKTPSAKVVANCITGLKRLRPSAAAPPEAAVGPLAGGDLGWDLLDPCGVPRSAALEAAPVETAERPDVQAAMADRFKQLNDIADALESAGFDLAGIRPQAPRFRPLDADPLTGAVAPLQS